MRKLVGVKPFFSLEGSLKKEALMFEQVAVPNLKGYLSISRSQPYVSDDLDHLCGELEWLCEQEIIFEPVFAVNKKILANNEHKLYKKLAMKHYNEFDKFSKTRNPPTRSEYLEFLYQIHLFDIYIGRLISLQLRDVHHMDAHIILPTGEDLLEVPQSSKADVIHIVLNTLPVPDDSVPWEHIMEYRNDPDSKGKFLALRNWMSELTKAQLSPLEIEEKLEWLIYDYQRHINLHKLKTNLGIFETILTVAGEFVEDLIKVKWGRAAKTLFFFKHRRIALMEAEIKAPGSEIAYVRKAQQEFKESE